MAFNDFLFRKKYYGYKWSIPCEVCGSGELQSEEKKIQEWETFESYANRNSDPENWESEYYEGAFIAELSCDAEGCGNNIAVSGQSIVEITDIEIHDPEDGPQAIESVIYLPRNFSPVFNLIEIPMEIEFPIRKILYKSFELYWLDNDACANKIRQFVESLLDSYRVKKRIRVVKNGTAKYISLPLHKRIEEYTKTRADLGEILMAIKWIGNAGSHHSLGLENQDLVDAYRMLDHFFEEAYFIKTKRKKIKQLTKTILKTKKPVSKSKRKK
ncbi:MAG: DUF4145 domain-containing protein [Leptospiraceae bacterium]|nr:DUF4145 domain-containing protein [Leptospiraceae bacterium]